TAKVPPGPDPGRPVHFDVAPVIRKAGISAGDELQVARYPTAPGQPPTYAFVDFARSTQLVWLAIAFPVLVVAVARLRGLAALIGLALSFAVLIKFTMPALLAAENPLAVALVSCAAIMMVLLYL